MANVGILEHLTLPDGNTYDIHDANAVAMTGATASAGGTSGFVPAPTAGDNEKFLKGDGTWADGGKPMVILSYGSSTWNDFITAYNNNVIVYCRASSNSNPASGSQTRLAFMAYVNNAATPTEVEFQYYRSVSSHTASQQGDQVFVYKLTSSGSWTVTARESMAKIVAGTNLSSTYSNNVLTINGDYQSMTGASSSTAGETGLVPAPSAGDEGKYLRGDGTWNSVDISGKADKADTVLTTTLSRGRKASTSVGTRSFAFGDNVTASGTDSYAQGSNTTASEEQAHAEGRYTTANGYYSHAEGNYTTASGMASHAEGTVTTATHANQHVFGEYNVEDGSSASAISRGNYVEIVGNGTGSDAKSNARALDWDGNEYLKGDLYVGCDEDSTGGTKIDMSVKADKEDTVLTSTLSRGRKASTTVGTGSFAFGNDVTASGIYAHAEGFNTSATGSYSHAEGGGTTARVYSHAEGYMTKATGDCSHSEGQYTTAQRKSQHVSGEYNVPDTTGTTGTRGSYAEIIGNGTSSSSLSNARALDWDGNERLAGELYVNCNDDSTGGTKVITTPMTGASSSVAGATGLVPAPSAGDQDKFLKANGTWATPPFPPTMGGASSTDPGVAGLVPAPAAGDQGKYLRGDGTWAEAGGTVYGNTIDMSSTDSTKVATAIGNKLDANQGSANEGKFMRVDATGAVSYEFPIERYSSISNFPATGDLAKIYIAVNTGKTYIWDASDGYVIIGEPHVYYGTSSSGSSDAEKAVTVNESFYATSDIPDGTVLYVNFTNQNTRAYSLKLNINSGGGIYVNTMAGSSDDNALRWSAGEWVQFVFLNSRWKVIRNGAMRGATFSFSGKEGLVPTPSYGDEAKFLRGDGSWAYPANMTGATASAAGAAGFVPAPSAGDQNKVLTGAGTWWTAGAPLLTPSTAFSIPSVGTPAVYDMPGLTANHELIQWNFSASAENNPPASLSWETYDGYFMITNNAGTTSETIKPVFAQMVSVAITPHVEAGE